LDRSSKIFIFHPFTIEILELGQVPAKNGGKHIIRKSADFHPRQGNLLQRNNLSGAFKTSLHFTKYLGWRSAEKNYPFFQTSFF
jgi:hypothetical protein